MSRIFTPLILKRLFAGVASVLIAVLLVMALDNSPITGALEAETLRWRFEIQRGLFDKRYSNDVVIVYLPTGNEAPKLGRESDAYLARLLQALEQNHPKAIGVDLSVYKIDDPMLETVLKQHQNIVLGDAVTAVLPDLHHSSLNLYSEENGLIAQIPTRKQLSGREPFCRAIAPLYKTLPPSDEKESTFINYGAEDFETFNAKSVLAGSVRPELIRNRIVLVGEQMATCILPGRGLRVHKADAASNVMAQAYAIQTLLDDNSIRASSQDFQWMLYSLAVIALIMPILSYRIRLAVFSVSLISLLLVAYFSLKDGRVFIQIWPFLVGLVVSFLASTVVYTVTDLKERNRQLQNTQSNLEKRNLELVNAKSELENREKQIALARELGMEEERKRIALDLHDDALKELFLASSAVEKSTTDGLDPEVGKEVQRKLHEASEKIRRVMANLFPNALSVCGLSGAVESLCDVLRKESDIEVSFQSSLDPNFDLLSDSQALLVYRIVQEAFNNILKHADASKVCVTLGLTEAKLLTVTITDNGGGLSGRQTGPNNFGMASMKHRATLLGATINWEKSPHSEHGTEVNLEIPLVSS